MRVSTDSPICHSDVGGESQGAKQSSVHEQKDWPAFRKRGLRIAGEKVNELNMKSLLGLFIIIIFCFEAVIVPFFYI